MIDDAPDSTDSAEFVSIVIVDNILPPSTSEDTGTQPIWIMAFPCLVNLYPFWGGTIYETLETLYN